MAVTRTQQNPPTQGGGGGGGGDPPNPNPPAPGGGGGGGAPPGGGGGGPPGPGGPPAAAAAVPPFVFGLTPGLTANDAPLDYLSKVGYSRFKSGTEKLEEELYDCSPDGFFQFMQSIRTRAEEFGWSAAPNGILWVAPDNNPGTQAVNMLDEYGILSLERITEHEQTYLDTQTRRAQDDRMLYECLLNSISIEGKAKVNIYASQYKFAGNQNPNENLPSGLALLKVVIRESHLDTNATTSMIRTKLSNLDAYINTIGNDITKFNGYVQMLIQTLATRGETTQDLLTNLFKGYAACSDKTFVDYIVRKQETYKEGSTAALTAEQLMEMADQKYRTLKSKEIWEAPSPEEEKLIALEARFSELKKKLARQKKAAPEPNEEHKKNPGGPPKSRKERKEKPAWMFVKPKPEDLHKSRKWNGTDWYWCGSDTGGKCEPAQYRAHKPSKCKGTASRKRKAKDGKDPKGKKVVIQEAVTELQGGYKSDE